MKAITLRNLPKHLELWVRRRAEREGISLNKAVIRTLEERLGTAVSRSDARHHDLDEFAGSWTGEDARAFERELAAQRAIDPDLWP